MHAGSDATPAARRLPPRYKASWRQSPQSIGGPWDGGGDDFAKQIFLSRREAALGQPHVKLIELHQIGGAVFDHQAGIGPARAITESVLLQGDGVGGDDRS